MSGPDPALYRRATGPRVALDIDCTGERTIPSCPWCKTDCEDVPRKRFSSQQEDHQIAACPSCHKEFMWPDRYGEPVLVGLISPTDLRYLDSRRAVVTLDPSEVPY